MFENHGHGVGVTRKCITLEIIKQFILTRILGAILRCHHEYNVLAGISICGSSPSNTLGPALDKALALRRITRNDQPLLSRPATCCRKINSLPRSLREPLSALFLSLPLSLPLGEG